MKNFIFFHLVLLSNFALFLAIGVFNGVIDPASLVVKSWFSASAVSLGTVLLIRATVRRYNPPQFITFFAISNLGLAVGAFSAYLLFIANLTNDWRWSDLMSIIAGIVFTLVLTPLTIHPSFSKATTNRIYELISLLQIIFSGLITWTALAYWLAYP